MTTVQEETFLEFARRWDWFHAIELGDIQTCGRYPPPYRHNASLLGVFDMLNDVDLAGLDCLDVGAVDGLSSFALKAMGAGTVTATDRVENQAFLRVRAELGLDIDYRTNLELEGMVEEFGEGRFDLIICAGVIYHMLNPFSAFQVCRRLLRPGGILVMESASFPRSQEPVLYLESESQLLYEAQTYFLPTPAAIDGMMRLAYFDVLASRLVASVERYAVMGRATTSDQVQDRTPLLREMHRVGYTDYTFPGKDLDQQTAQRNVRYHGERGAAVIGPEDEKYISFPYHPDRLDNPVGTNHWPMLSRDGATV